MEKHENEQRGSQIWVVRAPLVSPAQIKLRRQLLAASTPSLLSKYQHYANMFAPGIFYTTTKPSVHKLN